MNRTKNCKTQSKNLKAYTEEEIEDKMRVFVNLIIDKVLEERKQGIYRF